MCELKVSYTTILQYLMLYFVFIMQDAAIYNNYANPTFAVIVIAISVLICCKIGKMLQQWLVINAVVCYFFYFMAKYLTGDIWLFWFWDTVARISVSLVAYNLDRKMFAQRFLNVVYVFSFISLIFFVIVQIDPSIAIQFASRTFKPAGYSGTFYGGILYLVRTNELMRNAGIFMEPGLYSIVLSVAIYILILRQDVLVSMNSRKSTWMLIVFIVTMLTTQSTSGYMNVLVCFLGVFVTRYYGYFEKSLKRKVILISSIIVLLLVFDFTCNRNQSLISLLFVDKLNMDFSIVSSFNNQYDKMTSGSWRLITVVEGIEIIKQNPVGVGLSQVEKMFTAGASGATFIREIAGIGVFPVLYKWAIQIIPMIKKRKNIGSLMAIMFIFLNYQLNQSNIIYPAIFSAMLIDTISDEK